MNDTRRAIVLGLVCVATGVPAARAHHGWSEYDPDHPVRFTGTIESVDLGHPHASLVLKVDGKAWRCVLAPPSRMKARGIDGTALRPGDSLTLEGLPKRDGTAELRVERLTIGERTVGLR